MQQPEEKKVYIRLSSELFEELSRLAERQHRSINGQIVYLLERALARQRRREEQSGENEDEILMPGLALASATTPAPGYRM
jgi:hypothetical protein